MINNQSINDLSNSIEELKQKQIVEIKLLKAQFEKTYEGLKPLNLIKNTISEVATSTDLRKNITSNAIGLATGYLSKKFLLGSTHNPFKKILGTILEFGIANFVAKKANDFSEPESSKNKN